MLMSFVGAIGSLMTETGLSEVLKSVFGGVEKMLTGKKFPMNMRAMRTSKMWVDAFIKPILIMMLYVRAEREGDWLLHLQAVKPMLPYFFASRHVNYARYGVYYLRSMEDLPNNVLQHFAMYLSFCWHGAS